MELLEARSLEEIGLVTWQYLGSNSNTQDGSAWRIIPFSKWLITMVHGDRKSVFFFDPMLRSFHGDRKSPKDRVCSSSKWPKNGL